MVWSGGELASSGVIQLRKSEHTYRDTSATTHVLELSPVPKHAGANKVNHSVVLHQVVLEGGPGEHQSPLRRDLVQRLEKAALVILDEVPLINDHQVWSWRYKGTCNIGLLAARGNSPQQSQVAEHAKPRDHDAAVSVPLVQSSLDSKRNEWEVEGVTGVGWMEGRAGEF